MHDMNVCIIIKHDTMLTSNY